MSGNAKKCKSELYSSVVGRPSNDINFTRFNFKQKLWIGNFSLAPGEDVILLSPVVARKRMRESREINDAIGGGWRAARESAN